MNIGEKFEADEKNSSQKMCFLFEKLAKWEIEFKVTQLFRHI
jgi:hypothetical protein